MCPRDPRQGSSLRVKKVHGTRSSDSWLQVLGSLVGQRLWPHPHKVCACNVHVPSGESLEASRVNVEPAPFLRKSGVLLGLSTGSWGTHTTLHTLFPVNAGVRGSFPNSCDFFDATQHPFICCGSQTCLPISPSTLVLVPPPPPPPPPLSVLVPYLAGFPLL